MKRPPRRESFRYYRLCLHADTRRYGKGWWHHTGFWTGWAYRSRRLRKFGPWYRWAFFPLDVFLTLVRIQVASCDLPSRVRIGPGLYLPHPDGVFLIEHCRIGSEVAIFQQVTLANWFDRSQRIRAHVCIFPGAKVVGGVVLEPRCLIGANAVVTKNVSRWHVAVGVPARTRLRADAPVNGSATYRIGHRGPGAHAAAAARMRPDADRRVLHALAVTEMYSDDSAGEQAQG